MKFASLPSFLRLAALVFLFSQNLFAQPANWEPRGPGGGGAYFAPSINPLNNNEFYVTTDMGGVYRTTNFGQLYELVPYTKLRGGVWGAVRFTNVSATRYAVDYADWTTRPMKSTNSGNTWSPLPGNPYAGDDCYGIWADFANPNRIVIANWGYVHISQDGGTTFSQVHQLVNQSQGIHVAGVFFDGANIYIATNEGFFVSHNGGSTFANEGFPGLPAGQVFYSFCGGKQNGTTRFCAISAFAGDIWGGIQPYEINGSMQGVYAITYAPGATWALKMAGIPADYQFVKVAMSDVNASIAYLAGRTTNGYPTVFKTANGGTSWAENFKAANNVNVATGYAGQGGDLQWYWPEVFFDITVARNTPNRVLVTDYGFVHKTSNGGTAWQQAYVNPADQNPAGANTPKGKFYHSIGLENTSVWQVAWFDSLTMFGCYTDIKGARSLDGGLSWGFDYTGHDQNTMYRIAKKNDANTWYAATSSVHDMYETTYLQDSRINGGTGKVLFTNDKGATWQLLHDFGRVVVWVAADPTANNRLYASVVHSTSTIGGIWKSDNIHLGGASTWTKLPNPPRTEGHPFNIVVLNDGKVLCTYSGRRNASGAFTASSGVFLYDPATNAWADRSHANMQYYTKDITVDPNDPAQNTWYVGVWNGWGGPPNDKSGLYKSTNRGLSWTRLNDHYNVSALTFKPGSPNEVYYTTETTGLWRSTNINAAVPTFTQVANYTFGHPKRVFFNPYKPDEMWVTNFGNSIRVGSNAACTTPTGITTQAVSGQATQRKVLWQHVFGSTSYQVHYRVAGSGAAWTTKTATINSITLTGLALNTTYEFQVRAKCASGPYTPWSAMQNFTTPPSLLAVDAGRTSPDVFEGNALSVFPNPAQERTTIALPNGETARLRVFNAVGAVVFSSDAFSEKLDLQTLGWPGGLYFLQVRLESGAVLHGQLLVE